MHFQYRTRGTCSQLIELDINEQNVIEEVSFLGGCQGNLTGISTLVKGMYIDDVITKLSGIQCGYKGTSCPDQLALALRAYKEQKSL